MDSFPELVMPPNPVDSRNVHEVAAEIVHRDSKKNRVRSFFNVAGSSFRAWLTDIRKALS